jgi:hypothetical protein
LEQLQQEVARLAAEVAQLRTSLSGLLAHLQPLEEITAVPSRFSDQAMLKFVKRLKQRVADSLSAAARWKAKAKEQDLPSARPARRGLQLLPSCSG